MINSCRSSDYELSGKIKFVQPSIEVVSYLIIRVGSSTSLPFYRDERSSFNWPIRHPTTNLIINVERETYRGWLLHANDSHFNAYCSPQTFQGDILLERARIRYYYYYCCYIEGKININGEEMYEGSRRTFSEVALMPI